MAEENINKEEKERKNKIINCIYNISTSIINNFGILIISGIFILNLLIIGIIPNFYEKVEYRQNYIIVIGISILITILIGVILKNKRIKGETILIIVTILQIILGIIWINISKYVLISDQHLVHNIGRVVALNMEMDEGILLYIMKCPHQLGIGVFIGIIYKITGISNYIIIQYLNVFSIIIITYMLYKITNAIYNDENKNKIVSILSLLFIQFPMLSTFVYGDIIGLMFVLIAVYQAILAVKKNRILNGVYAGIALGFGVLVRTNYNIILIATIMYLLLNIIKNIGDYKKSARMFLLIIIITILAFMPTYIVQKYMTIKYKDDIILNRPHPLVSYLIMAARTITPDESSSGWWSGEINDIWNKYIVENLNKKDIKKEMEILRNNNSFHERLKKEQWKVYFDILNNYIKRPEELFRFYGDKISSIWTETTFQSIWVNDVAYRLKIKDKEVLGRIPNNIYFGDMRDIYQEYCKGLMILIYFGAMIEIYNNRNSKKKNNKVDLEKLYLIIIFLGGFSFHILWEAKSRYIIPYVIILFPLASNSLNMLTDKIFTKKEEYNRRSIKREK